jgi:hypothetical protein
MSVFLAKPRQDAPGFQTACVLNAIRYADIRIGMAWHFHKIQNEIGCFRSEMTIAQKLNSLERSKKQAKLRCGWIYRAIGFQTSIFGKSEGIG